MDGLCESRGRFYILVMNFVGKGGIILIKAGDFLNIKFDSGAGLTMYSVVLEQALKDITKKIGVNAAGISWVIFDEKSFAEKKKAGYFQINISSFLMLQNYQYGLCYIDKKEIWISTTAIQSYSLNSSMLLNYFAMKKQDILLVNVILDELAHIKTGKDHGNTRYDSLLQKYHYLYYK